MVGETLSNKIDLNKVTVKDGVAYADMVDVAKGKPLDFGRELYLRLHDRFSHWPGVTRIEVYQNHLDGRCTAEVVVKAAIGAYQGAFDLREEQAGAPDARAHLMNSRIEALADKIETDMGAKQ